MKKVFFLIAMMCLLMIGICGCAGNVVMENDATHGNNKNVPTNERPESTNVNNIETTSLANRKIAVVYFSATGNTRTVAEYVKEETGGDIFEIIPLQKYTAEDLNYGDDSTRATAEQHNKNARPEIANEIDVSNYDVVFLGYPIWWGDTPRIIQTLIETGILNGKTVIPFCTSGSSGIAGSESTLKQYNQINWMAGKRFSGNSSKMEVKSWIQDLKLLNNIGDEKMTTEVK